MVSRSDVRWLLFSVSLFLAAGCTGPASDESAARRTEDDPVAEDTRRYVGDEACADCHGDLYQSYHRTGMGRSVSRFDPATAPERFDGAQRVYDAGRNLYYEPFVRGDTLYQREYRPDARGGFEHERVYATAWVIGSGKATRSYLMNVNGHVTEMPLTWYMMRAAWDLSPGYEQVNQRFDRPITLECMTCHNGLPSYSTYTQGHYTDVPMGITCERCHGPASEHVEARLAGLGTEEGTLDPTIVNTARLDRALQLAVCQQCHLTGVSVFRPGHDMTTYRPGQPLAAHRTVFALQEERDDPARFGIASHAERLARSACFQQSAMTCTTCHDPHYPVAELGVDVFNQTCRTCHTPAADPSQVACSRNPAHTLEEASSGNCVGCHLQKSGTSDIPHVMFTDHWIRRTLPPARQPEEIERMLTRVEPFDLVRITEEGEAAAEDRARRDLEEAIAYFKLYETRHRLPAYLPRIVTLIRQGLAGGAEHPEARLTLGRALAEMDSLQHAEAALRAAVERFPDHVRAKYWLATVLIDLGQVQQAATHLRSALEHQPHFVEARLKLAEAHEILGAYGQAQQAYQAVIDEDPIHHPAAWNNLGFLRMQQNRLDEADSLIARALDLDPDFTTALVNLGSVRLLKQELEAGQALFERALHLDPDQVAALGNLGLLYAQQQRYEEAKRMLERVIQLQPGDQRARQALAQIAQLMDASE